MNKPKNKKAPKRISNGFLEKARAEVKSIDKYIERLIKRCQRDRDSDRDDCAHRDACLSIAARRNMRNLGCDGCASFEIRVCDVCGAADCHAQECIDSRIVAGNLGIIGDASAPELAQEVDE